MSTMPTHTLSSPPSQLELQTWLTGRVAYYLEVTDADIDVDVALNSYGLDSVYAFALCGEIEDTLDVAVEPTLVWDIPTVSGLAAHLAGLVG